MPCYIFLTDAASSSVFADSGHQANVFTGLPWSSFVPCDLSRDPVLAANEAVVLPAYGLPSASAGLLRPRPHPTPASQHIFWKEMGSDHCTVATDPRDLKYVKRHWFVVEPNSKFRKVRRFCRSQCREGLNELVT